MIVYGVRLYKKGGREEGRKGGGLGKEELTSLNVINSFLLLRNQKESSRVLALPLSGGD